MLQFDNSTFDFTGAWPFTIGMALETSKNWSMVTERLSDKKANEGEEKDEPVALTPNEISTQGGAHSPEGPMFSCFSEITAIELGCTQRTTISAM